MNSDSVSAPILVSSTGVQRGHTRHLAVAAAMAANATPWSDAVILDTASLPDTIAQLVHA